MATNSVYRVRTLMTWRSQNIEYGVHIQQVTAVGGAQDLAGVWANNVVPTLVAATSADVNYNECIVSDTDPNGEESVHFAFGQPLPGALAGESLPNQNAVVIQLSTGQKGPRRHGRLYFPGITETASSNGFVTGAQLTAIQAVGTTLISLFGPAGSNANYRLVVYSPVDLTPPPPRKWKAKEEELITPVTATRVDSIIRTQRRRAIGVGR
jgi:hypothetical protein